LADLQAKLFRLPWRQHQPETGDYWPDLSIIEANAVLSDERQLFFPLDDNYFSRF
jgi:hypothetical protein